LKTINISKYFFRGRKIKRGGTRKSVNITINKKDGIHLGKLLSLAITKHILILLFLKKYQVNFEDLDIDEKLIVVKTDKINSPSPLTTTSAFNGVPLQVLDL
jgi:hypothetical protein